MTSDSDIGRHPSLPTSEISKGKIVVVDDFPGVAESLAFRLRIQGYEVYNIVSSTEAIAFIGKEVPDLALIDVCMPIIDGYEVARRLRQIGSCSDVMLVAISGWLDTATVASAISSGFDLQVTKPIDGKCMDGILQELAIRMQRRGDNCTQASNS